MSKRTISTFIIVSFLIALGGCNPDPSIIKPDLELIAVTGPIPDSQNLSVDDISTLPIELTAIDPDGDPLVYSITSYPQSGTLTGTPPELLYTPTLGFGGVDMFIFSVTDGKSTSTAMITIFVTHINHTPMAQGQSVTASEDEPTAITLTASDSDSGDTLSYSIVEGPAHGSLSGTAPNLVFTPHQNFHGDDSFTFKVNDGTVDSSLATVNITVTPVPDAPVALEQSYNLKDYETLPITLSGTDADSHALTYSIVNNPTRGVLSGTLPNLVYTPNNCANGTDSFTFKVSDGSLESTVATISFTVTASGTANNPTIISSPSQMRLTNCSNRYFRLSQDIDFGGNEITPYGLSSSNFDGQGYTIKNFNVSYTDNYNLALFGSINNSIVRNLHVTDFTVTGSNTTNNGPYNLGGLAASGWGSTFFNVHMRRGTLSGYAMMAFGGLVGSGCNTTVVQSSTDVTMNAQSAWWPMSWQGGLVGACGNGNAYSFIANSYTTNSTLGIGAFHGGGGSARVVLNSFDGTDLSPDTTGWDFTNIWQAGSSYPELRTPGLSPKSLKITSGTTSTSETKCFPFSVEPQDATGSVSTLTFSTVVRLYSNSSFLFFSSLADCTSESNTITTLTLPAGVTSVSAYARVNDIPWGGFSGLIFAYADTFLPTNFSISVSELDSDEDGQSDNYDQCPTESGPYWNNYCPTNGGYLYFGFDSGNSVLTGTVGAEIQTNAEFYTSSQIVSCTAEPDGSVIISASCACSEASCTVTYSSASTIVDGNNYGHITVNAINSDGATMQNNAWMDFYLYEAGGEE